MQSIILLLALWWPHRELLQVCRISAESEVLRARSHHLRRKPEPRCCRIPAGQTPIRKEYNTQPRCNGIGDKPQQQHQQQQSHNVGGQTHTQKYYNNDGQQQTPVLSSGTVSGTVSNSPETRIHAITPTLVLLLLLFVVVIVVIILPVQPE